MQKATTTPRLPSGVKNGNRPAGPRPVRVGSSKTSTTRRAGKQN